MKPVAQPLGTLIIATAIGGMLVASSAAMASTVRPSGLGSYISGNPGKSDGERSKSQPNPGNGKSDKDMDKWGKYNNHGHQHPTSPC